MSQEDAEKFIATLDTPLGGGLAVPDDKFDDSYEQIHQ